MMRLKMRIRDLFVLGSNTIFSGDLEANCWLVSELICSLRIGDTFSPVLIKGEVQGANGHRDLWTGQLVSINRSDVLNHEVWLLAE